MVDESIEAYKGISKYSPDMSYSYFGYNALCAEGIVISDYFVMP
jgi:hypothetical protein